MMGAGFSSRWIQIIKAVVESGGKVSDRGVVTDDADMFAGDNSTFDFARNVAPEFDRIAAEFCTLFSA